MGIDDRFSASELNAVANGLVRTTQCQTCGAEVSDPQTHHKWHNELEAE